MAEGEANTSPQQPTIGRIVHFVYDASSALQANQLGGNRVEAGDIEAAVVVKTWDPAASSVNLKVFRDGPRDFWATSVVHNDEADSGYAGRSWHWPPRV